MIKGRLMVLFIGAALLPAATAYAHHSFTATYYDDKTIKVEGKIIEFLFRNPHSFVHVMAPDENGVMQRWNIEWGGAGQLGAQAVTRETIKPGDYVVITGSPGRNASDHRVRMKALLRPSDGFGWGNKPGEKVE